MNMEITESEMQRALPRLLVSCIHSGHQSFWWLSIWFWRSRVSSTVAVGYYHLFSLNEHQYYYAYCATKRKTYFLLRKKEKVMGGSDKHCHGWKPTNHSCRWPCFPGNPCLCFPWYGSWPGSLVLTKRQPHWHCNITCTLHDTGWI